MKSRYSAYPYVIWMVIFTVVPLLLVAAFAITDSSGAYTLENISAVGEYTPVLMRSIWLAAIATVLCLVIAYPLAYILSRKPGASSAPC